SNRCGASYRIVVLVSVFNSSNINCLSFLSDGRNASKQNLLVGSPDIVKAVIHATGPGSEVTSIPSSIHCRTSSSPGSEIPGVPASVIHATDRPVFICSTKYLALSYLLNS